MLHHNFKILLECLLVHTLYLDADGGLLMWLKGFCSTVNGNPVTKARAHRSSHDETYMRRHGVNALFFYCVVKIEPFILCAFKDEASWDGRFVFKSNLEVLRGIHLGETYIDDRLFQTHDGTAEFCLARETYRCAIFNLDKEISDSGAYLTAANYYL